MIFIIDAQTCRIEVKKQYFRHYLEIMPNITKIILDLESNQLII